MANGRGCDDRNRRGFGVERLGGLVDLFIGLFDTETVGDFGLLRVDRRLDRRQSGGMNRRMVFNLFAERIVRIVSRSCRRLGRFEAHVVPAEVLEVTSAHLAKALGLHGRASRTLPGEKTG